MKFENLTDMFGFAYTMPERDFPYWVYVLETLEIKENEVNLEFLFASRIFESICFIDHDVKFINFTHRFGIEIEGDISKKESYENYKALVKKIL